MANSRNQSSLNPPMGECRIPARTCGPLGVWDQADPNVTTLLGDTPGSLGCNDYAGLGLLPQSSTPMLSCFCVASDGVPLAKAVRADSTAVADRKLAGEFSVSTEAINLLKAVETLRLKPYDDQTSTNIKNWVEGATIGYGHLIKKGDWDRYKDGITETCASDLFNGDLGPFVATVRSSITAKVTQNEFDALVILAYNIGSPAFSESSVVQLVNDPKAKTGYKDLESAWKAWDKSQGKVMKGLENRRQCEWNIYTQAIYQRW